MINEYSDDWKAVAAQVSEWLEKAVRLLESDQSELETAKLRARIKCLREVLALPSKKPAPRVAPLSFGADQ